MTFCDPFITPALIAGPSFAERISFSAMLCSIGLWALFGYAAGRPLGLGFRNGS